MHVLDVMLEAACLVQVGYANRKLSNEDEAASNFATARRLYNEALRQTNNPTLIQGIDKGLSLIP